MISTLTRALASTLAASLMLAIVTPWAQAGTHRDTDHESTSQSEFLDDDAVITFLPANRPRPIAGAVCDEVDATAARRGVTYTCTEQPDGALVWVPDAKTVGLGEPCLVRGEHTRDPAPRTNGTDAALLACVPGSGGALTWSLASRVCISAVATRDEVAAQYAPVVEQLTALSQQLRVVRATDRLALNREVVRLRTSVATMNGLLTRLSSAARTACGR